MTSGQLRLSIGVAAILALASGRPASGAVDLGATPTECEIQAALLGVAGPGCPPPAPAREPPPPARATTTTVPAASPVGAAIDAARLRADFRIEFAFASAEIAADSIPTLDRLAAVMNDPGAVRHRFAVVGHTDAVGGDAANLALSLRRAAAVRDYLVRVRGVAEGRLEIEGRGRSRLADPAHPKAAVNRRVEVVNLGG